MVGYILYDCGPEINKPKIINKIINFRPRKIE
jgi:hypothetical protein